MSFRVSRDDGGATVVRVEGQLIVGNRQELKDLIGSALEAGDRKFLIDFANTGYIDSSGLGLSLASWMPSRLRSAKPSNAKQMRRRSLKDQVNVGRKPAMLAHSGSFGDTSGQARLA